jgi:hypothetical protein
MYNALKFASLIFRGLNNRRKDNQIILWWKLFLFYFLLILCVQCAWVVPDNNLWCQHVEWAFDEHFDAVFYTTLHFSDFVISDLIKYWGKVIEGLPRMKDTLLAEENYFPNNCARTLIKKKIKFSSYVRKFRVEQLQSH